MRLGASSLAALVVLAVLSPAARAEPPPAQKKATPQERKRQQLLDELGLERIKAPARVSPIALPSPEAPENAAAATPPPANNARSPRGGGPTPTTPAPSFHRTIHPLFLQSCQGCHRVGGPAGATRFILVGNAATDYGAVHAFVTPTNPAASPLLAKASGQGHGGGAPWPESSDARARVLVWIAKGARLDAATSVVPQALTTPLIPSNAGPPVHRAATPPALPHNLPVDNGPAPNVVAAPENAASTSHPQAAAQEEGIHAVLRNACAACHNPSGPAAATRFLLSGELHADLSAARAMIDPASPARSVLVTKAMGELHGGGVVLTPGDPRLATLLAWAADTTPNTAAAGSPEHATQGNTDARPTIVTTPSASSTASTSAPPSNAPHGPAAGLPLPAGFMLNGRFDLNYERRQFSGNPFEDAATNALRSYHHFLFLSRESTASPIGLSIEILSLQFWEVHARLGGGDRPWRLVIGAGKIIVPFGADPLMHQSYGGLAGFDQRILPAIWAQEGAAAHLTIGSGRLLLTDDAFVVHGYALARADAVLSLQSDFSPADDARIGWGNRLGVSWLNASAWYSAYFNPLGFGRRLFMQALDLTIWRPRTVPILGHFSAGAGLLRADVSGGGAGLDYYDIGSYFQLRYHPTDWLYVQYRQGLRTVNNRRGIIVDGTRLTPDDMSTHNFAVVGRRGGLSATLAYFLIFEKAGEIPNDFLRASVAYDF